MTADPPVTPFNPAGSAVLAAAERYAAGQMSESEELAFETQMLEDPQLAAQVDIIQRMRAGFRALDAQGEIAPVPQWSRFWKAPYAIAATVTLLVLGAAGVLMLRTPAINLGTPVLISSLSGGDAARVGAAVVLVHTRGAETPTEIAATPQARLIPVKILPAVASGTYRVTLEQLSGNSPTMPSITVDATGGAEGFVTLYLDSSRLRPGTYLLSVAGSGDTETFGFRLAGGD